MITGFQNQLLKVGKVLSGIVLAIGIIALIGWIFQIDELKTLTLSEAHVKFNSSVLLIISSLLLLFNYPDHKRVLFFRIASSILLFVGIITFVEHLFQIDLFIDSLLPNLFLPTESNSLNVRMTILAAINFTLLGCSFLALSFEKYFTAQILVVIVLISIYAVLIAYCFRIPTYYDFGKYSSMSFPTATGLFLTALGTLFYQPNKGLMHVVTGSTAGSKVIRYIYVYSLIFIPFQLALYLFLMREHAFAPEVGIVFVLIVSVTISFPITLFLTYTINRIDTERSMLAGQLEETNRELVDANHELQSIIEEYTVSNEALETTTLRLNESNHALVESNDKFHRLHNELAQMVVDRTADLEYTLIELQERNQELDQYVYKVSHDIRSPIASIKGVVNLIKLEDPSTSIRKYLDMVENRISKLDDFIQSVLSHSKSLNSPIVKEPVDFTEIIDQCWEELEFEEGWHSVDFNIIAPPNDYKGDQTRLEIIFKNLLANGVRYRNPTVNSFINIGFESIPGAVVIRIEDNGIGIEAEYLEKVFEMFFRGTESSEGSGLGLYIVNQVIAKMEGTINISSKINEGTLITITLPS